MCCGRTVPRCRSEQVLRAVSANVTITSELDMVRVHPRIGSGLVGFADQKRNLTYRHFQLTE